MRLPYLQVAMEVIEVAAPTLAVELDWDENAAIGGLVKMFRWALGRCPDDAPPSANDVINGSSAAKHLAKAAAFNGDPEAFVAACSSVRPDPLLERTEAGIRVCGLKRYDEAWATARTRADKARQAAEKRWGDARSNAQAMLGRCSGDAQPMLGACSGDAQPDARAMPQDAQTQTQTQTQTQIDEKAAAAAEDEFRNWFQLERAAVLASDVPADRPLKSRQVERLRLVLSTHPPNVLRVAAGAYFRDKHWRKQDPPCPLAGFIHQDQLPQYLSAADRILWAQQGAA
jgi:hypothetical protein